MLMVALFLVVFMRFTTPEIAILIATLLGCLIGVVVEKWQ